MDEISFKKERFETIFNEGIETEFISIEKIIRSGKLAMSHHIKMNYCQTFTNATAAKDLKSCGQRFGVII